MSCRSAHGLVCRWPITAFPSSKWPDFIAGELTETDAYFFMKKIFFFDIDNTLLDHRTKAIPPSALAAIARLQRQGHCVVVATGRSFEHANPSSILSGRVTSLPSMGRVSCKANGSADGPLAEKTIGGSIEWMRALGHSASTAAR